MSPIGKLLGILMVQRTLSSTSLFRHFLWGLAVFLFTSVLVGLLAGVLVIGGLWEAYRVLLAYGLDPVAAEITVVFIALLIGALLCGILCSTINKLHTKMPSLLMTQSPIANRVNELADSFLDGLFDPHPNRKG